MSYDDVPIDPAVRGVAVDDSEARELGVHFGEDFELVCTVPEDELSAALEECAVELTRIGTVTEGDVQMDGEALPDRGFTH